jgi:hypothetical protein
MGASGNDHGADADGQPGRVGIVQQVLHALVTRHCRQGSAYNLAMLLNLQSPLAPPVFERLTLVVSLRGLARTPWMRPRRQAEPRGPSPRA